MLRGHQLCGRRALAAPARDSRRATRAAPPPAPRTPPRRPPSLRARRWGSEGVRRGQKGV
eukprot:392034-Pyramimonas_sp.AAC.1